MRKGSKRPSKQRKFLASAPLHLKQKLVSAHLSKDLRTKYKKRSASLRKGDKVVITIGLFKKHVGKIEKVDTKKTRIFVNGVEVAKRDGSKKMLPLHPSNVVILELNMDDKIRQKAFEVKNV